MEDWMYLVGLLIVGVVLGLYFTLRYSPVSKEDCLNILDFSTWKSAREIVGELRLQRKNEPSFGAIYIKLDELVNEGLAEKSRRQRGNRWVMCYKRRLGSQRRSIDTPSDKKLVFS